jgi:hypothetical protein
MKDPRTVSKLLNMLQVLLKSNANPRCCSGWQLLLPESKREILGKDGKADELMFQAQMLLIGAELSDV